MSTEQEVAALQRVLSALQELDDKARERIMVYASSHFGIAAPIASPGPTRSQPLIVQTTNAPDQFTDFAELFSAAAPEDGPSKALVAAYWLQVIQGQDDFDAKSANDLLKDLGHTTSNITVAFDSLRNRNPALVLQTKKSGKTRQARKTYKLTRAGMSAVRAILAPSNEHS